MTDSRGRVSAEASVSITVTAYSPPYFNSSLSPAVLKQWTLDDDGTYIHALVSFGYSTCGGEEYPQDFRPVQAGFSRAVEGRRGDFCLQYCIHLWPGQISTETSYDVRYTLEDAFSTISVQEIVSTAAVVMDLRAAAKG